MQLSRVMLAVGCAALLTATAACSSSVNGSASGEHTSGTESTATPLVVNATLGKVWGTYQKGYGEVRPSEIFNGGDPTGLVSNVVWSSWGGPQATGTGSALYGGSGEVVADQHAEQTTVVAFNLGLCDGAQRYQAIEWFFPQHGEHFDPTRYIDICSGDFVDPSSTDTGSSTAAANTAASGSGAWSGDQLTITPTSLGVVKVGMSVQAAAATTGLAFQAKGDGARGPALRGQNELYVDGDPVQCVVASGTSTTGPSVTTEKGVGLGDQQSAVTAAYPDAQPIPQTGPFAQSGYFATVPGGQLSFTISNGVVSRIAGGADVTSPNCSV
ncbi:hypothetical protein EF294_12750 [Gordonia oryzae]|uniref:Uncharacterized protein n=1 Tax=Gordonia oryzae TaxID=2487349 RepID=A0A3N4GFF2_9ACTN|nr:hypothetical protein [Gordonia oryzae]RPA59376.1 hypothetical protein EF294_12750 [Gordonia oryzae]